LPNIASDLNADNGTLCLEESGCEENSEEESEGTSLPCLEMLNRFCLKIKEEAMISSKATERIRSVTISLLRALNAQSKRHVHKILNDYGIDHNSIPELEDVFSSSSWEDGSVEVTDCSDFSSVFPNISPREIHLGMRREWKQLRRLERVFSCTRARNPHTP